MSTTPEGYFPIDVSNTEIIITNTYSYYQCKIYVFGVILNTSVTLRCSIVYLKNGKIDDINSNDGTYSYMNRYVLLEGEDYAAWGQNDSYITNYVQTNIANIIQSTYLPDFNQVPYVDTYL
jgi:hypothetical protein